VCSPEWQGMWLGLNDLVTEGRYVWKDTGAVATYTNWRSGMRKACLKIRQNSRVKKLFTLIEIKCI